MRVTGTQDEQQRDVSAVLDAPCPVLLLDTAGRVVTANAAATRLWSGGLEPLEGTLFLELLDSASRSKGVALLHELAQGNSVEERELNHQLPNGAVVLLSYVGWSLSSPGRSSSEPTFVLLGRPESAALAVAANLAAANRRLETLLHVAEVAASTLSIDGAVRGALETLARDGLVAWAILVAPEAGQDSLQCVETSTQHVWTPAEVEQLYRLPFVQEALESGRPVHSVGSDVVAGILDDPIEGIRPLLVFPIALRDARPAGLIVASRNPRGFTDETNETLPIVAHQLRLTVENARLHAAVLALATTDALTGAANRRSFDQDMAQELERARRLRYAVGLLMLDVDHFKSVNDTYGHACGDAVLQSVVAAMKTQCRKIDRVARLGGEEFAVLMPGAERVGVTRLGERIRSAVSATVVYSQGNVLQVTASLGGAAFPGDASTGKELLHCADQLLYSSKRAGRNRLTVSS